MTDGFLRLGQITCRSQRVDVVSRRLYLSSYCKISRFPDKQDESARFLLPIAYAPETRCRIRYGDNILGKPIIYALKPGRPQCGRFLWLTTLRRKSMFQARTRTGFGFGRCRVRRPLPAAAEILCAFPIARARIALKPTGQLNDRHVRPAWRSLRAPRRRSVSSSLLAS